MSLTCALLASYSHKYLGWIERFDLEQSNNIVITFLFIRYCCIALFTRRHYIIILTTYSYNMGGGWQYISTHFTSVSLRIAWKGKINASWLDSLCTIVFIEACNLMVRCFSIHFHSLQATLILNHLLEVERIFPRLINVKPTYVQELLFEICTLTRSIWPFLLLI